jgi:NOL1/NOP2/sun family putative RNA methylase
MKLPKLLTTRLQTILGSDYESTIEAFSHERIGSFRINTLLWDGVDVFTEFSEKGIITTPFAGLEWVYTFDRVHEYAIKWTRAFYDGKIYLQSIASMLPVLALDPEPGEMVLDVCAAPGSKTTQLAMLMENTGLITAIEQNQIRYDRLMHNCELQWATIVEWEKTDARNYLDSTSTKFDRILIDAPCSAEGRIHLDNEKSYGFWSLDNIAKKAALQQSLLSLAYAHLSRGGTLVYSTCTLAPEENEGVISDFLAAHADATLMPIDLGLSDAKWWKCGLTEFGATRYDEEISHTVRILPSGETEGFYMARIKKI